jgi:hypothetical protein
METDSPEKQVAPDLPAQNKADESAIKLEIDQSPQWGISSVAAGDEEDSPKKRSRPVGDNGGGTGLPEKASAATTTASAAATTNVAALTYPQLQALLYPASHHTATPLTAASIPDASQVTNMTSKALSETPPYVHLSAKDCSSSLKIVDRNGGSGSGSAGQEKESDGPTPERMRLALNFASSPSSKTSESDEKWLAMGYRMIRASHGASPPEPSSSSLTNERRFAHYYYELIVTPPPSSQQIRSALPRNSRIGQGLTEELTLLNQLEKKETSETDNPDMRSLSELIHESTKGAMLMLGSHLRVGYSMRTAVLDAPVGYDRWSFGVRDVRGSKIHDSKREDGWGRGNNVPFGPADVVGCMITLVKQDSNNNTMAGEGDGQPAAKKSKTDGDNNLSPASAKHGVSQATAEMNEIRFFCNGKSMGQIEKQGNKRFGGEAFNKVQHGTYYPAISTYMGGSCHVNFGPHFIYPPNSKQNPGQLPSGADWRNPPMNKQSSTDSAAHPSSNKIIRPMSDACPVPPTPEEAIALALKRRGWNSSSKSKHLDESLLTKFKQAVETDARLRYDTYQRFQAWHLHTIQKERTNRGLDVEDLEAAKQQNQAKGETTADSATAAPKDEKP